MRIWKRLLGTALCLCAAVCVMSVSASAEGEHTKHPICGNIDKCTNPDHSDGDHGGDVRWIEVTQSAVIDGKLTLEGGKSYYLGGNIETQKAIILNQ